MSNRKRIFIFYTLEFLVIAVVLLYSLQEFSLIKGDDGMDQYYPVFVYCGKYIREVLKGIWHGQIHFPQFDFSIGMGEGVIPVLNYYGFGDPFMLFSALTPVEYSAYAYTATILIKMYVSGFCFIYYCKKRNVNELGMLAGVPFYIANNFLFYHCFQYPTYQSVLISLPLVCAGLDEVIRQKEYKKKISIMLILSLAYQALYGFYLLYMELLFAAVYALVELLCSIRSVKKLLSEIGVLFVHVLAGLITGGIFFVPSVCAYFLSTRVDGSVWLGWDVLLKLENREYWEAISSLIAPVNFSGMGIVVPALMILAVVLAIKRKAEHKDLKIMLVLLLVAYAETRLTSYIAGGFTADVYYNRWIFSIMFLISVMIGIGAEQLCQVSTKGWLTYAIISILYFVILILVEQKWFMGGMKIQRHLVWGVYAVLILVCALMFVCIRKYKDSWMKKAIPICMTACVCVNIYTLFGSEYGYGAKWNFKLYGDVRNEFLSSNVQLFDTGDAFLRKDIEGGSENEALYIGHYGTRDYYSMINENLYDFYRKYVITTGLNGLTYRLTGLDSRSALEDLLAVRYYDDVKKNVIIDNQDCLPLGFTFDQYCLEEEADKETEIIRNSNVLTTVVLNKPVENIQKVELNDTLVAEEDYEIQYIDIEVDGRMINVNSNSKILLTVDSKNKGECYFYTEQFRLYGISTGTVYFGDTSCLFHNNTVQNMIEEHPALVCLGNVEEGKTTFEICFAEEARYEMDEIRVFVIDTEEMETMNQKRQLNVLKDINGKGDCIRGKIELSKSEILFLGIPYGAGWKAYVNGEEAEILKADYGFMALVLGEGYSEIELRYFTPGLRVGMVCTSFGLILIVVLGRIKKKYSMT